MIVLECDVMVIVEKMSRHRHAYDEDELYDDEYDDQEYDDYDDYDDDYEEDSVINKVDHSNTSQNADANTNTIFASCLPSSKTTAAPKVDENQILRFVLESLGVISYNKDGSYKVVGATSEKRVREILKMNGFNAEKTIEYFCNQKSTGSENVEEVKKLNQINTAIIASLKKVDEEIPENDSVTEPTTSSTVVVREYNVSLSDDEVESTTDSVSDSMTILVAGHVGKSNIINFPA